MDTLTQFMNGFAAANQLMVRAGNRGCFVEVVCLATSVVDGLLRMGLVLRHQLDLRTSDVPAVLIHQAEGDAIVSERRIYRDARSNGIISDDQFKRLEDLYQRRNRVVHRYVISEITTEQVLQIASEYDEVIGLIGKQVRLLEDQQIATGIGMTPSDAQVPSDLRADISRHIQEMAAEKHGHQDLASNLKKDKPSKGFR